LAGLKVESREDPVFFISVASEEISFTVNLLFATLTLAGRSRSAAFEGLRGQGQ
jgi:hypothetical protein